MPPAEEIGGKGLFAGAVERHAGAHFVSFALAVLHRHTDDAAIFPKQALHLAFLAHFRAFFAGVIEEHLVELRAQDLPGLRDRLAVVAVEEVEGL